jgi:myosin-3
MAYHGLSQHVSFEELPSPGDRFILQDLIGEGTYGEVYSARDTVTGKIFRELLLKFISEIAKMSYKISSREPEVSQWPRGLT